MRTTIIRSSLTALLAVGASTFALDTTSAHGMPSVQECLPAQHVITMLVTDGACATHLPIDTSTTVVSSAGRRLGHTS